MTNETEYRAWNPRHNGLKRQAAGANYGFFGSINLLSPRDPSRIQYARPANKLWFSTFTAVQLRYEFLAETTLGSYAAARAINRQGHGFVNAGSGIAGLEPLTLQRTYFSFFDRARVMGVRT